MGKNASTLFTFSLKTFKAGSSFVPIPKTLLWFWLLTCCSFIAYEVHCKTPAFHCHR